MASRNVGRRSRRHDRAPDPQSRQVGLDMPVRIRSCPRPPLAPGPIDRPTTVSRQTRARSAPPARVSDKEASRRRCRVLVAVLRPGGSLDRSQHPELRYKVGVGEHLPHLLDTLRPVVGRETVPIPRLAQRPHGADRDGCTGRRIVLRPEESDCSSSLDDVVPPATGREGEVDESIR